MCEHIFTTTALSNVETSSQNTYSMIALVLYDITSIISLNANNHPIPCHTSLTS